jgi:osmotically-inducible protein OsmY
MRTDADIESDVKAELRRSPEVDQTDIAVKVSGGVVALMGFVHTFFEKCRAESAAIRVAGVGGVANDIEVRVSQDEGRADPEIARDAVSAIRSRVPIASENIQVLVDQGQVTLEGKVEWQYQREAAEHAVRALNGVRSIENFIQLAPHVTQC